MSVRLHVVYAGRGDAMLVEDDNNLYLLDAGPQGLTHNRRGGAPYPAYYWSACVSVAREMGRPDNQFSPDAIVVSHAHEDHYGGFETIFNLYMSKSWTTQPTAQLPLVFNGPLISQTLEDIADPQEGGLDQLLRQFALAPSTTRGDSIFSAFTFRDDAAVSYQVYRRAQAAPLGRTWTVDTSEDNLASVLMFHNTTKMAFTGDSAGYLVAPFIQQCANDTELSILKLPHHGSMRNSQRGNLLGTVPAAAWHQYALLCILAPTTDWDTIDMPEVLQDPGAVAAATETVIQACAAHKIDPDELLRRLLAAYTTTINRIDTGAPAPWCILERSWAVKQIWSDSYHMLGQQSLATGPGRPASSTPKKRGSKRSRAATLPELDPSWFNKLTDRSLSDGFCGRLASRQLLEFFASFNAANYVISADYSYMHPNVETLAAIAATASAKNRQVRVLVTDGEAVDFSGLTALASNWASALEIRCLKPPHVRMVLDVTNPGNAHDIKLLDPYDTTMQLTPAIDMAGIRHQFRNNHGALLPPRGVADATYQVATASGDEYFNLSDQGRLSVAKTQQGFQIDEAWTLALTNPGLVQVPSSFDVIRLRRTNPAVIPGPAQIVKLISRKTWARGVYAFEVNGNLFGQSQYVSTSAQDNYLTTNLDDPNLACFRISRPTRPGAARVLRAADTRAALNAGDDSQSVKLRAYCATIGVPTAGPLTARQLLPDLVGTEGANAFTPKFTVPVLSRILDWNADPDTSTVTYEVDDLGPDLTAVTLAIQLGLPLTFVLDGETESIATARSTLALSTDGATLTMTSGVTTTTGIAVTQTVAIPTPTRARPLDQYLHDVGVDPASWPMLTVGSLLSGFVGAETLAERLVMRCPSFIVTAGLAEWLIDHDESEVETQFTATGTVEVVAARIVTQTPGSIGTSIEGMPVGISAVTLVVTDALLPTMEVRLEATAAIGSVSLAATSDLMSEGSQLDLRMAPGNELSQLISLLPGAPDLGATSLPFDAGLLSAVSFIDPGIVIRQPALGAEPYALAQVYGTITFTGWSRILPTGFPTPSSSSISARVLSPLNDSRQVALEIEFEFDAGGGKTLIALFAAEPLPQTPPAWSYTLSVYSNPVAEPCTLTQILATLGLEALGSPVKALPLISDALSNLALGELTLTVDVPQTGPATVALADIGLVMVAGWDVLPGTFTAGPAQIDLHWDGGEWSGSAAAQAVLGGAYEVEAELDLPTLAQPGAVSFHSASSALTISAFAQICDLGDLSTIPVVRTMLDIAVTDIELVLVYPTSTSPLTLGIAGFAAAAGPQILGPLSLTSLGLTIEHYLISLNGVAAGSTNFLLEGNWGDDIIATLGYDGVKAELSAGLRMTGAETIGDLLSRLLDTTLTNALLPVIKDFVVNDGTAVLSTLSPYTLKSFEVDLDTSAALTVGNTAIDQLKVSYTSDPIAYQLTGTMSGPGANATVTIDCISADGGQTVTASIAPTPGGSGLTATGLLALFGLTDPPVPTPDGAPQFFDLAVKATSATFTVSPFSLHALSFDVVTTGQLQLLQTPLIQVNGLALRVEYDRNANPATSGYMYGQIQLMQALVTVKYVLDDGQPEYQASLEPVTEHTPDFAQLIAGGAFNPGYGLPSNLGLPTDIPMARVTLRAQPGKFVDVEGYAQTSAWNLSLGHLQLRLGALGGRVRVQAGAQPTDPATYQTWLYGQLAFNGFSARAHLTFGNVDTVLSASATDDVGQIQLPQIASALGSPWTDLVPAGTAVTPTYSNAAYVYVDFTSGTFALFGSLFKLGTGALLSVYETGDYVFAFGLAQPFTFAGIWPDLAGVDHYIALEAANVSAFDYAGTLADLETDLATVAEFAKQQGIAFTTPFADIPALSGEIEGTTTLPAGFSFFSALDLTQGVLSGAVGKFADDGVTHPQIVLWGTVDRTAPANTTFAAEFENLVLLGGHLSLDGTATYRPNTPDSFVIDAAVGVTLTEPGTRYVFHGDLAVGDAVTTFTLRGQEQPAEIAKPFGEMSGITITSPQLAITYFYPPNHVTTSTVQISGKVALTIGGHAVTLDGFVYFVDAVPTIAAVELTLNMGIADVFSNLLTGESFPSEYEPFTLIRGSIYYGAFASGTVPIGNQTYLPGYNISSLVAFFGVQFLVDIALDADGIRLQGSYVGEIDFVFAQLTGYEDSNNHKFLGPTVTVDTRNPSSTIYQLGCGISVFQQPFLTTVFGYQPGLGKYSGTATYQGTSVSFTYSDTEGLRITEWPLAAALVGVLQWAQLLEEASKVDGSACGDLAGLVFDKVIDTDFSLRLSQAGTVANNALPVQLNGTYTVSVADKKLFTLPLPTIQGSIDAPANFEFDDLVKWLADTLVDNAVAIATSLLKDIVDDQRALKILIAQFAIQYATKELLTALICRDADAHNVQDATNGDIDEAPRELEDALGDVTTPAATAITSTSLAGAATAFDTAMAALPALVLGTAAIVRLIEAAWEWLTGSRRAEKERAARQLQQGKQAVEDARTRINGLLAMEGVPTVTFPSATTVDVSWTTSNLPQQQGIDYDGYAGFSYAVDIATDPQFQKIVARGTTTSMSFQSTHAAFGQTRTIYGRVAAHCYTFAGAPIRSSVSHAVTLPAPATVTQTLGQDAVQVAITAVADATSYNVDLIDRAHGDAVVATQSVTQPSPVPAMVPCTFAGADVQADAGATLLVRAKGVGDPGTWRDSAYTTANTASAIPTAGPPAGMQAAVGADGVAGSWDPVPSATAYAARAVDATGAPLAPQPTIVVSRLACTISGAGVVEDATIGVEVRPIASAAIGLWSAAVDVHVHVLRAPQLHRAVFVAGSQELVLVWLREPAATGYQASVTGPGGQPLSPAPGVTVESSHASAVGPAISAGHRYELSVRGTAPGYVSTWMQPLTIDAVDVPVPANLALAYAAGALHATWSAVTNASAYFVDLMFGDGTFVAHAEPTTPSTDFGPPSVPIQPGTTYRAHVAALVGNSLGQIAIATAGVPTLLQLAMHDARENAPARSAANDIVALLPGVGPAQLFYTLMAAPYGLPEARTATTTALPSTTPDQMTAIVNALSNATAMIALMVREGTPGPPIVALFARIFHPLPIALEIDLKQANVPETGLAAAFEAAFQMSAADAQALNAAVYDDGTGAELAELLHTAGVDRATATTLVAACWPVLTPDQVGAAISGAYGPL